ncbi:hypothetical protein C943_03595 [Mariniradius saccharolyticus AK6]|jgi:hypothetical protein|uniref:ATP synthase protein I2 n=2 Tax=Mariniradius TaxID=1245590 RepID=M7YB43_9BACT|nr:MULTISPECIES: hypothetical protein [Mariniradius]EMS34376.1 hypothetical protein C943_03595 [Mariniradius saccharolyticus AK6]MCF1749557.1 hypothetical protein [Mariniradius sediminis]
MKAIKILTLKLILLSLLLGGVIYVIQQYIKPAWIHESMWTIMAFFIILTWITGMFTHYLLQLSKENSVSILLGGIGLRLLSSIGFVAVMLMLGVENIILFIVNFFIVYFLYLLFDIYMLIANLRPNSR